MLLGLYVFLLFVTISFKIQILQKIKNTPHIFYNEAKIRKIKYLVTKSYTPILQKPHYYNFFNCNNIFQK
tara:strand:- start:495 stop:704 length:210 start_codon:yes stop_codon:yes gene_type:complete